AWRFPAACTEPERPVAGYRDTLAPLPRQDPKSRSRLPERHGAVRGPAGVTDTLQRHLEKPYRFAARHVAHAHFVPSTVLDGRGVVHGRGTCLDAPLVAIVGELEREAARMPLGVGAHGVGPGGGIVGHDAQRIEADAP